MNLAELRERNVPRYTSYPTAPHFTPSIDAAAYRQWLRELPAGTASSVYLHVPFCAALCWYCGCHTSVVRGHRPISEYASLLAREIELVGRECGELETRAVHWGGGTPNMLHADELAMLTVALRRHLGLVAKPEVSAELDPRILTRDQVSAFIDCGLTRASLGVQDFDERVQRAINRIQPYEKTANAVEWLREGGIESINFDLIYGLPLQTVETLLATVDRAAALRPDRIALFGYAHVPWMKRHQRLIDEATLPGTDEREHQCAAAGERLVEQGYARIGVDHFALPGDALALRSGDGRLHRNFQGYTTDEAAALIGFGLSSIGNLPQGYVQNTTDFGQYRTRIDSGALATARGVRVGAEDSLRREVIERLMCDLEVDLAEVARRHAAPPEHFASELAELAPLLAAGVTRREGWRITVPEEARSLVRVVCAVFDTYLANGAGRHSRAV